MISRRKLLKACLEAGVAAMLGSGPATLYSAPSRKKPTGAGMLPEIQNHFSPLGAYVRIGDRYIRAYEIVDSPYRLFRSIVNERDDAYLCASTDVHNSLLELIKTRITHDYRSGNTRLLDGWILSDTELKLCALLSSYRRGNAG